MQLVLIKINKCLRNNSQKLVIVRQIHDHPSTTTTQPMYIKKPIDWLVVICVVKGIIMRCGREHCSNREAEDYIKIIYWLKGWMPRCILLNDMIQHMDIY